MSGIRISTHNEFKKANELFGGRILQRMFGQKLCENNFTELFLTGNLPLQNIFKRKNIQWKIINEKNFGEVSIILVISFGGIHKKFGGG